MALYKFQAFLTQNDSPAFDQTFAPGVVAAFPGIYRCTTCNYETAIFTGNLPKEADCREHNKRWACAPGIPQWRLAVYAVFSNS